MQQKSAPSSCLTQPEITNNPLAGFPKCLRSQALLDTENAIRHARGAGEINRLGAGHLRPLRNTWRPLGVLWLAARREHCVLVSAEGVPVPRAGQGRGREYATPPAANTLGGDGSGARASGKVTPSEPSPVACEMRMMMEASVLLVWGLKERLQAKHLAQGRRSRDAVDAGRC